MSRIPEVDSDLEATRAITRRLRLEALVHQSEKKIDKLDEQLAIEHTKLEAFKRELNVARVAEASERRKSA